MNDGLIGSSILFFHGPRNSWKLVVCLLFHHVKVGNRRLSSAAIDTDFVDGIELLEVLLFVAVDAAKFRISLGYRVGFQWPQVLAWQWHTRRRCVECYRCC